MNKYIIYPYQYLTQIIYYLFSTSLIFEGYFFLMDVTQFSVHFSNSIVCFKRKEMNVELSFYSYELFLVYRNT